MGICQRFIVPGVVASTLAVLQCLGLSSFAVAADKTFQIEGADIPYKKDGIRDPGNDAITVFQHPKDAMAGFPRTPGGVIDWVKALDNGKLVARSDKLGKDTTKPLDLDIIMKKTGAMPPVKFSHRSHTELFACGNCHPAIFAQKAGANSITMAVINSGQACGVCHGKVAAPPTLECNRCHSAKP